MTTAIRNSTETSWHEANHRYLVTELERLRLLLKRRVLWLRTQWKHDPLQSYPGLVISEEQADRWLTGPERELERRFYLEDPGAVAISRALRVAERDLEQQKRALLDRGQQPAIDVLGHLFHLSRFALDVVLLCLAPEMDASFERLYAYVQDDVARKHPTLHLALGLFGGEQGLEAWAALMSDGTLRRLRLLILEPHPSAPSTSSGSLRLNERLRDYLLGINQIDDAVAEWLRPLPSAPLTGAQELVLERLHRAVKDDGQHRSWPVVNLVGPQASGRRALALALCERLGLHMYGLALERLPALAHERHEAFRLLEREALLSQFALYVDAGAGFPAAGASDYLGDVVDSLAVFMVVATPDRAPLDRRALVVRLTSPDAMEQRRLWQKALDGLPHSLDGRLDEVVEQFDFGAETIAEVVVASHRQARLEALEGEECISAAGLWRACREHGAELLDDLAQRLRPCQTWDDIVLPDDVLRHIREIAAQVAQRPRVYETWGFGRKLNRGRGLSALFSGPSGTGKTMAAEVLASELDLDLYRIDLSGVVSKYIGETEKNLRRVFDAAERSGAILFFDEADALFGKRSEVKDSHDRYANIEVNYLLQRMEEYRGLAILATNTKSHMDQAFLRRLRFLVEFPFPEAAQRDLIWRKIVPAAAPTEGLEYSALARLEIPGGSIRNVAVNAAFMASAEGSPIRMAHLMRAALREYEKIEKLPQESEFGRYYARSVR